MHAVIARFGRDKFTVRILHCFQGPRPKVKEWANKTERELIADCGGVLRDMEPDEPIRQTFNLYPGNGVFPYPRAPSATPPKQSASRIARIQGTTRTYEGTSRLHVREQRRHGFSTRSASQHDSEWPYRRGHQTLQPHSGSRSTQWGSYGTLTNTSASACWTRC